MAKRDIHAIFVTGPKGIGRQHFSKLMIQNYFPNPAGGKVVDISISQILHHVAAGNSRFSRELRENFKFFKEKTNFPDDVVMEASNIWLWEEIQRNPRLQTLVYRGAPLTEKQFDLLDGFKTACVVHIQPEPSLLERRAASGCRRWSQYKDHALPALRKRPKSVFSLEQKLSPPEALRALLRHFWSGPNPLGKHKLERAFETLGAPIPQT